MKILFYGDSITDMGRNRENPGHPAFGYGMGYPNHIIGELAYNEPNKYQFVNRGIGGNRIVDLYARIKADVWNHTPDVLSILVGVNDVWHEWGSQNGVEIDRFERVYRMLIEDTKANLPNVQLIICEPFVLKGSATDSEEGQWEHFLQVKEYAKVVAKLAKEYGIPFVALQDKFDELAEKHGAETYLYDGVHPTLAGARLIANAWLQVFNTIKK